MIDCTEITIFDKKGRILLGKKKRGFGTGKIVCIGGKKKEGETILECASRELNEETSITIIPEKLSIKGELFIYFENPEDNNWHCYVCEAKGYEGEINESEEISPSWYHKEDIPFDKMWDDVKIWLPIHILGNKYFKYEFFFDKNSKLINYKEII